MAGKIIFADTNVILPQSNWDLYRNNLNKYNAEKEGRYLTNNDSIDISLLEKAISDSQAVSKFIDETPDLKFTKGVIQQSAGMIEKICSNIEERMQPYIFAEFVLVDDTKKEINKKIYRRLLDYAESLNKLSDKIKDNTKDKAYTQRKEESYFLINDFLRALDNTFFGIMKGGHKFDNNTDEKLATSALYESLFFGNDVVVYTNDKDVSSLIGTFLYAFKRISPAAEQFVSFKRFIDNPPIVYKNLGDEKWDLDELGKNVFTSFSSYNLPSRPNISPFVDAEKKAFSQKTTNFSNMLHQFLYELSEMYESRASEDNAL